jgi:hypothetical protein
MNTQVKKSLLTQSLEALDLTGASQRDVEGVLKRHPEQAGALEPLIEAAVMTSKFYADVPEAPGGLVEGRLRVLAVTAEQRRRVTANTGKIQRPSSLFWRFAGAVIAVVLALIPLRGTLVSAASDSLPGHPFYMFKLSAEDQLFKSVDDAEVKAVLAISLVEERMHEVRALVERQQAIPVDVLYRTDFMLRTALDAAAWAPERIMPNMLDYITHHIRMQIQTLELLKAQATPENLPMLNNIQNICLKTQIIAMVAWENPQAFRAAYQAGTPEKMPLPSGGPLSGVLITEELKNLATSTPDSYITPPAMTEQPALEAPTPTSTPTMTPTPTATSTVNEGDTATEIQATPTAGSEGHTSPGPGGGGSKGP